MAKRNCWEEMNCGRQEGGAKVSELGVCPVSTEARTNGVNGGKNGGRVCWAVVGTLCKGEVQGSFAEKFANCVTCDFYQKVLQEEENFEVYPAEAGIEG